MGIKETGKEEKMKKRDKISKKKKKIKQIMKK